MGSSASKQEDDPRTFWLYAKANMHTVELKIEKDTVTLTERKGDAPPIQFSATLNEFIDGKLHDEVTGRMNEEALPDALASARVLVERTRRR